MSGTSRIDVTQEAKQFLLHKGVSQEYGARELKRTIHRQLTQPLATMVARGEIRPGAQVSVSLNESDESLSIVCIGGAHPAARQTPTILIVDDNHDLLFFLAGELKGEGWEILIAENGPQARLAFYQRRPDVVLLDYMFGEDDGLQLGFGVSHAGSANSRYFDDRRRLFRRVAVGLGRARAFPYFISRFWPRTF